MKSLYDLQAPTKSIDLSINIKSNLLTRVRALNIDLSSTIENALEQEHHERQWKTENRTAIKAYNDFVEDNGCFSDEHRN